MDAATLSALAARVTNMVQLEQVFLMPSVQDVDRVTVLRLWREHSARIGADDPTGEVMDDLPWDEEKQITRVQEDTE